MIDGIWCCDVGRGVGGTSFETRQTIKIRISETLLIVLGKSYHWKLKLQSKHKSFTVFQKTMVQTLLFCPDALWFSYVSSQLSTAHAGSTLQQLMHTHRSDHCFLLWNFVFINGPACMTTHSAPPPQKQGDNVAPRLVSENNQSDPWRGSLVISHSHLHQCNITMLLHGRSSALVRLASSCCFHCLPVSPCVCIHCSHQQLQAGHSD